MVQAQSAGREAIHIRGTGRALLLTLFIVSLAACGAATREPSVGTPADPGGTEVDQSAPPSASEGTPDDRWIVYQGSFGGIADLGLVRPDGTDSHRIPGGPGNRWHPAWSPDGTQIAYDWNLSTGVAEIAVVNLDGSDERSLLSCVDPCLGNAGPTWSPDGGTIGFDGAEGPTDDYPNGVCYIALLDLGSGEVNRILEMPECFSDAPPNDLAAGIYMRFSPDGDRIVFQGEGPQGTAIFTATIDGEDVRQLTEWGLGARPDWSPDGDWIAFMSVQPADHPGQSVSLHRVRADGTDLQPLTAPTGTTIDLYPRWLPDGRGVLFSRCPFFEAPDCEAWIVTADGADEERLLPPFAQHGVHVMWQPVAAPSE